MAHLRIAHIFSAKRVSNVEKILCVGGVVGEYECCVAGREIINTQLFFIYIYIYIYIYLG